VGSYSTRREGRRFGHDDVPSGRLERMTSISFCDMSKCMELASWRLGYGSQTVAFCSRHTLATMRNRRIWVREG
jgi:hypothetical protein